MECKINASGSLEKLVYGKYRELECRKHGPDIDDSFYCCSVDCAYCILGELGTLTLGCCAYTDVTYTIIENELDPMPKDQRDDVNQTTMGTSTSDPNGSLGSVE